MAFREAGTVKPSSRDNLQWVLRLSLCCFKEKNREVTCACGVCEQRMSSSLKEKTLLYLDLSVFLYYTFVVT